jgi:hypothetical protein
MHETGTGQQVAQLHDRYMMNKWFKSNLLSLAARYKVWVWGRSLARIVGCVLCGSLSDGLITRPDDYYRLWCARV